MLSLIQCVEKQDVRPVIVFLVETEAVAGLHGVLLVLLVFHRGEESRL